MNFAWWSVASLEGSTGKCVFFKAVETYASVLITSSSAPRLSQIISRGLGEVEPTTPWSCTRGYSCSSSLRDWRLPSTPPLQDQLDYRCHADPFTNVGQLLPNGFTQSHLARVNTKTGSRSRHRLPIAHFLQLHHFLGVDTTYTHTHALWAHDRHTLGYPSPMSSGNTFNSCI